MNEESIISKDEACPTFYSIIFNLLPWTSGIYDCTFDPAYKYDLWNLLYGNFDKHLLPFLQLKQ